MLFLQLPAVDDSQTNMKEVRKQDFGDAVGEIIIGRGI
jgi:hypothetical protein